MKSTVAVLDHDRDRVLMTDMVRLLRELRLEPHWALVWPNLRDHDIAVVLQRELGCDLNMAVVPAAVIGAIPEVRREALVCWKY